MRRFPRQPAATRVLLLCKPALLREGLRLLLAADEDLELVTETSAASHAQDVAMADVAVISCAGVIAVPELIHRLQTTFSRLPILVIALEPEPEDVEAALAAGATGFLPLRATPEELIWALHNVSRGRLTLHPALLPSLANYLVRQEQAASPAELEQLTPREQEVLAHLVRGASDRDIAQTLFLSVRTVQTHLSHIYEKLDVDSRTEAAVMAVRAGWFPAPGQEANQ